MPKARYEEIYNTDIRPQLKKELNISNIMRVPKIAKIVLNVGAKEAVADGRILKTISDVISKVAGQTPVKTKARKSIAGFKIREDMPIGVMVTLRGENMYIFLDKLINLALPKGRDFQGVSTKLDGRGNYNLGLKEVTIFPEAESMVESFGGGLNITIHTTAKTDEEGFLLLKKFGMPFKHSKKS